MGPGKLASLAKVERGSAPFVRILSYSCYLDFVPWDTMAFVLSLAKGEASTSGKLIDAAPLGVLCMAVSVLLFPLSDACLKYLLNTYSVEQTAFLRALVRFVALFLSSFFYTSPWAFFRTKEPWLHGKRILVSIVSTYCFMAACRTGSLTLIYTLGYMTPLFMVVLSALSLKEKVSPHRWIAVCVGMAGVCLALRPTVSSHDGVGGASFLVLIGTFFAAMNKMYIRKLAVTEESLTIALYPNLVTLLLFAPFVATAWQSMPFIDWMLFGAVGIALGLSQLLVAFSLRCAQASLLAPLDYSTFVWVVLIDTLWWDKNPNLWTIAGACVIILSNLVIISRSKTCQPNSITP